MCFWKVPSLCLLPGRNAGDGKQAQLPSAYKVLKSESTGDFLGPLLLDALSWLVFCVLFPIKKRESIN